MTYRKLAVLPFVWVALFTTVALLVPSESRPHVFLAENETSKAAATLGCFVAAFTFGRGEYMRRAWAFTGWCYLLLFTRDILVHAVDRPTIGGIDIHAIEGSLALFANLSSVFGTWLLARAWATAGLELPGSRLSRIAIIAAAGFVALAISGSDLVVDGRELLAGQLASLHSVASDLGDIFGLCLIAPVLLTAVAMRGGVLRWTWGLLAASLIFWLIYDGTTQFDHFFPGHEAIVKLVREASRALACVTEGVAGFAQRRAITEPAEVERLSLA